MTEVFLLSYLIPQVVSFLFFRLFRFRWRRRTRCSSSRQVEGEFFVEVFAGCGLLIATAKQSGVAAVGFDYDHSAHTPKTRGGPDGRKPSMDT